MELMNFQNRFLNENIRLINDFFIVRTFFLRETSTTHIYIHMKSGLKLYISLLKLLVSILMIINSVIIW